MLQNVKHDSVLIRSLLSRDNIMTREPDWEQPEHVGRMALLFTCAKKDPRILKGCPFYYSKHLEYLRDAFPQIFKDNQISIVKKDVVLSEPAERLAVDLLNKLFKVLDRRYFASNRDRITSVTSINIIRLYIKAISI